MLAVIRPKFANEQYSSHNSSRTAQAFTLIEILVAVVVLHYYRKFRRGKN